MMRSFIGALAAITLCAAPAAAQPHRVFVNVNYGGLTQTQDLKQTAEFDIYGETASWEADHTIEGGPFFDIGGGFRLMRNLFVGASFTQGTKQTRDVTVNATVPSPVFTDTFRSASATATGLEHTEKAVHLQALLQVPVTVEFGVTLFGGPTFFTVDDELVSGFSRDEAGGDFTSVSLSDIRTEAQSHTATGFHVGFDAQYMFMRNAGVGGMVRYSKGSVDLTAPADTGSQTFKIDTGGLEIGAGLRFRF
ncbi:MAG: outer membrane beta-barrel protein [Vicinamibacterales bacterium]